MSDRYPSGRLPWEVYRIICSHLARSDQAQFLRVCHQLFEIAVPYLWREVSLLPLLLLLEPRALATTPGGDATNPSASTQAPAKTLVEHFRSYGKHVEHLTIHSFETGRADWPADPYQSILPTSPAFSEVLLPRLKSLSLNFTTPPNFQRTETWIIVFVPSTLQKLSFHAHQPQDTWLVKPLHSRFPDITRFELNLPEMPESSSWDLFDQDQSLRALEELELECHELDDRILAWVSTMPKLCTLRLNFHGFSLISESLFSTKYPGSFSSLQSIYIRLTESNWYHGVQIWQSPLVSNLTRVILSGPGMIGSSLDLDEQLFSALAAHSPTLRHIEIRDSGPTAQDNSIPTSFLLILASLPLRVLRIQRPITREHGSNIFETVSKHWPDMEELLLSGTKVKQAELLELPKYLPKVRHVHFNVLQEETHDGYMLCGTLGRYLFRTLDTGPSACLRIPGVWCGQGTYMYQNALNS